ncbi:MAG TPA: hypothetical protein VFT31_04475 [Kribbella sp.]|nr:hypothetical protein [Kribbella sp.]
MLANPGQARALLAAVREIYPSLESYCGCEYTPEVRHLTQAHLVTLPDEGWGEMLLDGSQLPCYAPGCQKLLTWVPAIKDTIEEAQQEAEMLAAKLGGGERFSQISPH